MTMRSRRPNNRMKLTSALAPDPRDAEEGHSAFVSAHRALVAYLEC